MINIADLKDPDDSEGRTYREVNLSKNHIFELGELVELGNGCRLFVARLTRDCDGTPLYSLTPHDEEYDSMDKIKWVHGYSEDSLVTTTKQQS